MKDLASYRILPLVFLLAGAALTVPAASSPPETRGPNIVFIMADDLGYGDLGCYGHPTIRTPNIDSLARDGMKFLEFYSVSSLCTPSRAALMTGRLPIRSDLNRVLPPVARRGLPKRELTVAELLRSAGYRTACIGKWHLGRLPKFLPTRHGFDRFFGLPYSNDMSRRTNPGHPLYRLRVVPPLPLMRGEKIVEREPDQSRLTLRYTEEAIDFITDCAAVQQPFFLYLPHTAPHPPLHASERFRGKSSRGLYGDVVEEMDWSTGEILRLLEELKLTDDTFIIFTSDNGPWLAKKENGGSPGVLKEGKGSTWEGGVRVPFIARWPGRIPAGVTTSAFGTLMDMLPTFAELTGEAPPQGRVYDGASLLPALLDGDTGREALLYYWVRHQVRAVRKGPWKLHVITNSPSRGTREARREDPPLLFHLGNDPGEQHDVAADHPEIVAELQEMITNHKKTIKR